MAVASPFDGAVLSTQDDTIRKSAVGFAGRAAATLDKFLHDTSKAALTGATCYKAHGGALTQFCGGGRLSATRGTVNPFGLGDFSGEADPVLRKDAPPVSSLERDRRTVRDSGLSRVSRIEKFHERRF